MLSSFEYFKYFREKLSKIYYIVNIHYLFYIDH